MVLNKCLVSPDNLGGFLCSYFLYFETRTNFYASHHYWLWIIDSVPADPV
mgnify:CR=1 FL=1